MSGSHPYAGLPDAQFWRRAVSSVDRHLLNPVVAPKFRLAADDRVATSGSCFAQHISRKLQSLGFNYLVSEPGDDADPAARKARGFGVYSARFGNVYTARQLHQLIDRAYGRFVPAEPAWRRADGRWVDPFRPGVEPAGYDSPEAMEADRTVHLAAVREMFEQAGTFVFTMGLTEAWRARHDGAVFPLAPGASGGEYDPARHEFVNFGVAETEQDMEGFLSALRAVNPYVKVLLTVSPVPLVATYEPRHVLVSTTYSKSVLRVAAETLCRGRDWIDYFPSYEIITGSFNGGSYYESDHREVNSSGVAHAMRCFVANYLDQADAPPIPPPAITLRSAAAPGADLFCDEQALDQVRE